MKRFNVFTKAVFVLFLTAFFSHNNSVYAANITWSGGGDGVSWTDPANWNSGTVPGPADNALFGENLNITIVQGSGTPTPVQGLWVFNNSSVTIDLDLTISGLDPVRVFKSTISVGAGRTFNITGTNRGIIFWRQGGGVFNVEAGATVNITAPIGVGSQPGPLGVPTLPVLSNHGTMNFSTTVAAIRPNNVRPIDVVNHVCGTMNLGNHPSGGSKINFGSASNFTNDGLITYGGNTTGVLISAPASATNNGFYKYANINFFASGAGTIVDNGIDANNAANLMVDAANSCSVADLGINAAYTWYSDAANTNLVGSSDATGALTFDNDVFAAPGSHAIYTCFGNEVSFTVNNIDGTCVMAAPPPAAIPTMSEWAVIILGIMMIIIGTLSVSMANKPALATSNGGAVNMKFKLSDLPFEHNLYIRMAMIALGFVFAVFTVAVIGFGYELTSADPIGILLASGLTGYWLMLVNMDKKS